MMHDDARQSVTRGRTGMVRSRSCASERDVRGFARARSFARARGVHDDDATDDANDDAMRATMRMMTTTTTTASVRAMRANDGRAMFRTRGMGAPTATGEETRREAMRRKLMVTTAEGGEFRDEGETEGDGDGDGDAMAVRGESRGVHRAPEFVRRPRDASGRPRAMGEGEDVHRISAAADARRFDPSSLLVDDAGAGALRGEFAKQFWALKRKLMDCVVMVRHGSFYNMFDVDADAGMAVGLRLTGNNGGFMRKVGCRAESFDEWATRLLASGRTVARVEQMEDAAKASGKSGAVIRRECCEILTPALDRGLAKNELSNYFITIAEARDGSDRLGVSAVDGQSGHIAIASVSRRDLYTVLVHVEPKEVVISETLGDDARKVLVTYGREDGGANDCVLRILERSGVALPSITRSNVLNAIKTFKEGSGPMSEIIERASELELQSVGYAMRHLAWCGVCEDVFVKVQFTNLMPESGETTRAMETERNPSAFALLRDVSYMKLDGEAVKCLHILTGDTGKLTGSLFEFLNQTLTPSGRRRLRQWLVKPLREVEVIQARLDVVEEFSQDHFKLQTFRTALKRIKLDYERLFTKSCRLAIKCSKVYNIVRFNQSLPSGVDEMGLNELSPKGASTLEEILLDAVNMMSFWEMHKRELVHFTQLLDTLIGICDVVNVISDLAPRNVSIARLCQDLDGVRPFLCELRSSLVVTPNGKKTYVVTPSVDFFQEYGEFARQAIAERNQDPALKRAAERHRKELRQIYIPLSDDEDDVDVENDASDRADLAAADAFTEVMLAFREEIPRFERVVSAMCDLDVLQGFATTCASSRGAVGFVRPTFSPQESKNLEISKSWHPLLKPSIVDDDKGVTHDCGIIDNDVSMATPFTLLTGPNMSGKSSLLRQIALTFIMAQCGCYVPARECDISVADAVMTRIGGDDNLANGISTFLSEMQGSSKIMQDLTSSTLVILDELGRGTSTLDGYAIAYAVSRELIAGAAKPRVFFATHYHELANDLARDPETGKSFIARHIGVSSLRPGSIRMKFKLETGPAPLGSCALHVARLAGFPPGILTRAAHVAQTVNFKTKPAANGDVSAFVPPKPLLSTDEHLCLSALVTDAAVVGDFESLGDGVAWCKQFYALWLKCRDVANQRRER